MVMKSKEIYNWKVICSGLLSKKLTGNFMVVLKKNSAKSVMFELCKLKKSEVALRDTQY